MKNNRVPKNCVTFLKLGMALVANCSTKLLNTLNTLWIHVAHWYVQFKRFSLLCINVSFLEIEILVIPELIKPGIGLGADGH